MLVHEAVASTIVAHGIDTIFGLIGDANILYVTDLMAEGKCRFVPVADERASVLAAGGYALASDSVGVATVTHGPAITNTVTALVEQARGSVPIVLVTGDPRSVRDHLQWVDIHGVANLTGAGYERVWKGETAAEDTVRAFRRARTERRPIILDVPYDFLERDSCPYSRQLTSIDQRIGPDPDALDDALGMILAADRPVVIAGRGAVRSGAAEAIVAVADCLGAPLATSLLAKDLFRGHRLDLGVCGTVSTPTASGRLAAADVVIAFGASLNQWTAAQGALLQNCRVVQVDVDGSSFDRFTPVALGLIGDARITADRILGLLLSARPDRDSRRNESLAAELAGYDPSAVFTDRSDATTIDPRTAMIKLDLMLPQRRNLVTDVGRFAATAWRYLHVDEPAGFVHSMNFGSIGLGLGTALGVASARPDRPTLAVVGDGGFMQSSTELRTIVNNNLPIVTVIQNDGAYGQEWAKLERHGLDPNLCRTNWGDFAAMAEACGMRGYVVRTLEELEKLRPVLTNVDAPFLVDIHIDPALNPSPDAVPAAST